MATRSKTPRNKPIRIGDVTVQPGKRENVSLPIAKLYTATSLHMPVKVLCGRKPGPVLFLSAAIEYLFPPFQGDTVTLFGAFLVATREWSLALVLGAVTLGSLCGAAGDYWLGAWLARRDSGRGDRGHRRRHRRRRGPAEPLAARSLRRRVRDGDPLDTARNDALTELALRERVDCVASNNVHYATPDRRPLQDVMTAIRDDPPEALVCQPLYPWLDQIALPLVVHELGGGRPGPELDGRIGGVPTWQVNGSSWWTTSPG